MSTPIDSKTNSSLFPMILDGKRPTAPGMPSNVKRQWDDVVKWYSEQRIPDTLEQWQEQYKFATSKLSELHVQYAWEQMIRCQLRRNEAEAKRESRKKALNELGAREFTLTYTPSWYEDDASAQLAMRVAIDKLSRYYKDEIIEFHAIGEYTKDGKSHVHAYYLLKGGLKITDKNFKRAWKHWNPKRKLGKGFEGGHHANISRISDFAGYIEKHLEEAWMDIHINNANPDQNPDGSN